jgi:outer membrane protein assembly factor BamB
MRFQTLDYTPIVCQSIFTGDTLWTMDFPGSNSRSLPIGFRDGQVYAINFRESGNDTIYALNPLNGSVIWRSNGTYPIAGINIAAAFTSNGDLILPESGARVMRINHLTGQKMWSTPRLTPNTSSEYLTIFDTTAYGWTGGITTPKQIAAISVNTGVIKYSSPGLPGDGDQESTPTIGPDGTIYAIRDGGNLYAIRDSANALTIKWSVPLPNTVTNTITNLQMGVRGNYLYAPYGKGLGRFNTLTGALSDTSGALVTSSTFNPRVTIAQNGNLFVSNGGFGDGALYALAPNLTTIWSAPVTSINNSGPAAAADGSIIVAGNGTTLKIFKNLVGIQNLTAGIPDNFSLKQNYPNPFNPETNIGYSLPVNSNVRLVMFDAAGREVKILVNEFQNAGNYNISFNGSGLASGAYFYRLITNDFTETKKMLLVK